MAGAGALRVATIAAGCRLILGGVRRMLVMAVERKD